MNLIIYLKDRIILRAKHRNTISAIKGTASSSNSYQSILR